MKRLQPYYEIIYAFFVGGLANFAHFTRFDIFFKKVPSGQLPDLGWYHMSLIVIGLLSLLVFILAGVEIKYKDSFYFTVGEHYLRVQGLAMFFLGAAFIGYVYFLISAILQSIS